MSVCETSGVGRHSAPDDDDVVETAEQRGDVLVAASGAGRHAAPDSDSVEAETATADETVADTERLHPRRPPNADLRMLREDPALRARCAAAVIVPFVLYTAVLLVIGRTGVYLIWLWIPTVTAGVLAGTFLDIAAKRRQQPNDDD